MLKDALDAYINKCRFSFGIARDTEIDELYSGLFREFLTYDGRSRNITACTSLYRENIERMGDHVTSIAEQVVYVVTGEMPPEKREGR